MEPATPTTADLIDAAAQLHRRIDPLHSMIYFAPEIGEELGALGLESFFARYFAQRSAAMGAVGPGLVTATFGVFAPAHVARHVAGVWSTVSPADVLTVRLRAADRAYRRLLGDAVTGPSVEEAAHLARRACAAATPEDRPLHAAHADLPWPDEPHLVLWHAATLLREYRGDVHLHALTAAGYSALESLIMHTATGRGFLAPAARTGRGWSTEQWAAASAGLRERGLLAPGGDDDPVLTEDGVAARAAVEDHTSLMSLAPTAHLGDDAARLTELATGLGTALREAGAFPEGVFAPGSDRAPRPGQGGDAQVPG